MESLLYAQIPDPFLSLRLGGSVRQILHIMFSGVILSYIYKPGPLLTSIGIKEWERILPLRLPLPVHDLARMQSDCKTYRVKTVTFNLMMFPE